jgi:glycosyltransferase involved in cell wall biosynthesis
MTLHYLPAIGTKHLDAIVHSALSTAMATASGFDVVHYHAIGPGLVAPLPRYIGRSKVVLTVQGLDGDRAKWGSVARRVLHAAEWMSARVPDATVVVSEALRTHYRDVHGREAVLVPNGATPRSRPPAGEVIERLGLEAGRYALFVGRLVPEKAPDALVRGFAKIADPDLRLVVAGGSSYSDDYVDGIRRDAADDDRVVMPGYVYGAELDELFANAGAFVLPSHLEGLPLTLLEAMTFGIPVIVSDIGPHQEVFGPDDGEGWRFVPPGDEVAIASAVEEVLHDQVRFREGASHFPDVVNARFGWDGIVDRYESVYADICGL